MFLIAVYIFLTFHFSDSLWTTSIDLAHHYALTARLSHGINLPIKDDPSLGEMNIYPRYSHRLAAIAGNLAGSPLAGMQVVAILALAAAWSGLGLVLLSFPGRAKWLVLGTLALLLLVNRAFVHLELFGDEIVGSYFFAQVVSQGILLSLIALVFWLERLGAASLIRYLVLGFSVPILEQFHLLPALEGLTLLGLLLAFDLLHGSMRSQRRTTVLGAVITLASASLTVFSSTFRNMMSIAENNGVLILRYTTSLTALVIEALVVSTLSMVLTWQFARWRVRAAEDKLIALKYIGILGLAIAVPCLLQAMLFRLGYGSGYACKKYAFGLNTLLVIDLALLLVLALPVGQKALRGRENEATGSLSRAFQPLLPGLFVLLAVLTVLPSPSSEVISVAKVVAAEKTIAAYEAANPPANPAKYDYAIDLFPNLRNFDYLISIGTLKAPRVDNADDMLNGHPPSKPKKISRVFTREGASTWDVPACRQAVLDGNIVVLDGACVLQNMSGTGSEAAP